MEKIHRFEQMSAAEMQQSTGGKILPTQQIKSHSTNSWTVTSTVPYSTPDSQGPDSSTDVDGVDMPWDN